jgi:hypothetical protein
VWFRSCDERRFVRVTRDVSGRERQVCCVGQPHGSRRGLPGVRGTHLSLHGPSGMGFWIIPQAAGKCGGLFVMQGGSPFPIFEAQAPVRRWGAVDVGTEDAVERAAGAAFHAPNRIPRPPHRETTDGSRQGLSRSRA